MSGLGRLHASPTADAEVAALRADLAAAIDQRDAYERDLRSTRVELEGLRKRVRSLVPELDRMIAEIEVPT